LKADISTNNNLLHEPTIAAAISVALEGLPYSQFVVDEAIEKINSEVPGLINSENDHIAKDISNWLQTKL
jgi:lipoate-protein ligase A